MEEFLAAAVIFAGISLGNFWLILAGALMLILLSAMALFARRKLHKIPHIVRSDKNPILKPIHEHPWESEAVFNPAALYEDGKVHLLYRALGHDGVSRIGYAWSTDGIHFERLPHPVFVPYTDEPKVAEKFRNPFAPEKKYNPDVFASGGGWGGSEDPRLVLIDGRVYMTFSMFESWQSMRMCVTSIDRESFLDKRWHWNRYFCISPKEQTNKNWVLFPEKINGKFAILHALTPDILINYADSLEDFKEHPIQSNNHRGGRKGFWDGFVRGASAPPLKTKYGWLLFYHGMDPAHPDVGYKVGAMLLDLKDPTKILYRSAEPILTPDKWYENDWKAGVVYASGAIIKDGTLFLYYGGGDKTVSVATAPVERFLKELMQGRHATLEKVRV
jgi:beta-1,2-mannobiose phosphorylase / 1,2-beta-oligomannan phosphorylase